MLLVLCVCVWLLVPSRQWNASVSTGSVPSKVSLTYPDRQVTFVLFPLLYPSFFHLCVCSICCFTPQPACGVIKPLLDPSAFTSAHLLELFCFFCCCLLCSLYAVRHACSQYSKTIASLCICSTDYLTSTLLRSTVDSETRHVPSSIVTVCEVCCSCRSVFLMVHYPEHDARQV